MKLIFLSLNPFPSLPLTGKIMDYFGDYPQETHHVRIGDPCQSFQRNGENVIDWYADFQTFSKQTLKSKIKKYGYFIWLCVKLFSFQKSKTVLYTPDYQILWIALGLKILLGNKHVKLVYHEFEVVEFQKLTLFNRVQRSLFIWWSRHIDLVMVSEKNRADYLLSRIHTPFERCWVLPNTSFSVTQTLETKYPMLDRLPDNAFLVGHVGSSGTDHFVKNFAITKALLKDEKDIYFVFVGRLTAEVRKEINGSQNNFIEIPHVPHDQLKNIYPFLHVGMILYRPIDLNFRYCAPNKLYEYWSYGVPVVAHRLEGLMPLFVKDFQGKLVDMELSENIASAILEIKNNWHEKNSLDLKDYFNNQLSLEHFLPELENKLACL